MSDNLSISENIKAIEDSEECLQKVVVRMRSAYARINSLSGEMRNTISSSMTNLLADKIATLATQRDRNVEENMARWNGFYASHKEAIHRMYSLNWE